MTSREKLIEILKVPIHPHLDADPAEVVADYLLDNGIIVPLCKIGDTVYAFEECFGVVLPFLVEQIIITYGEKEPLVQYCGNCHDNENDELLADIDFEPEDIGATVFLTKEEAEYKVKETEKYD